ncbi:hypothetical protein PISMIDRAFT_683032, partial [Pisolithus microcarpus 441]
MYHFSGWLSFFYIQLGNYQNDNDTGPSRLRATAKNFKMTIYRKENHRSPLPSLDQAVVSRLLWIWSNVMEPKNIVEHCYYTCQNIDLGLVGLSSTSQKRYFLSGHTWDRSGPRAYKDPWSFRNGTSYLVSSVTCANTKKRGRSQPSTPPTHLLRSPSLSLACPVLLSATYI